MHGTADIVVDRPVGDVLQFISNIQNLGSWGRDMSELVQTAQGECGVDSTFASKYAYRGKRNDVDYKVTAFAPESQFGCEASGGPFPFMFAFDLEPSDEATRVTSSVDAGPANIATKVIFGVAGPFLRKAMSKHLQEDLNRLKSDLETGQ